MSSRIETKRETAEEELLGKGILMAAQYDDEIVQALVAARAVIRRMGYQATDSAMISDLRLAFRVLDDAGLFSQLDRQIQYPRLESASDSKSSSKGSV